MRTQTIRKATMAALGAIMLSSALALGGCSGGNDGTNENGGTKATLADHNEWTTVADSSGRVWSTVVKIEPSVGTELDEGQLVSDLSGTKTFDWVRVICSDNKETNKKEVAYLFLTTTSDYGQLKNAVTEVSKKSWSCTMLDATTYESYVDEVKDGTYPYVETTYES